jgi:hypothetical protein
MTPNVISYVTRAIKHAHESTNEREEKSWTTESEYLDLLAAGQVLSFVEMPARFAGF